MSRVRFAAAVSLVGLSALIALAPMPVRAADDAGSPVRPSLVAGSGTVATEARSVAAFQAISTVGTIGLTVRQAAREAVEVRADDNLLAHLETVVESDGGTPTLKVRWKRGSSVRPRSEAAVTVDVVSLKAITSAGSARVTVEPLSTPTLKLSMSGSGEARLSGLQAGELVVGIAGSGGVQGDGRADRVRLSIAGSGDARLGDLAADEIAVSIAGSGDATVNARKVLTVSIAGSGDVVYTGEPVVSSSIAGSGRVRKR